MDTPWTSKWYDETHPHHKPRWTEVAKWADTVEDRLAKLEEKRVSDMAQERYNAESKKAVEEAGFHAIRDLYYREALESAAKMVEGRGYRETAKAIRQHKVQP